MSDLSQTILAGTSQISGGMRDLLAAKERKTARKQAALQSMNEAFGEAAKSFKEYRSFEAKKVAENDVKQILEAERLGTITKGGARGGLIALETVRPSTVEGYNALVERREALTKQAQTAAKLSWDRVQDTMAGMRNAGELANARKRIEISEAELELAKNRDRRAELEANKPPAAKNIDDLSDEGIAQAVKKAEALKGVKGTELPSGPDQLVPPKTLGLLAKKYGVDVSLLEGMTFRDVDAISMDPQEEVLQTLRVQEAQRRARDYESPELKAARKKLSALERDLAKYDEKMATMKPFEKAVLDPVVTKQTRDAKVQAIRDAKTEVGGLVGGADDEDEDAPVDAPAPASDLRLSPENQAKYDAMTPEQQARVREALGK